VDRRSSCVALPSGVLLGYSRSAARIHGSGQAEGSFVRTMIPRGPYGVKPVTPVPTGFIWPVRPCLQDLDTRPGQANNGRTFRWERFGETAIDQEEPTILEQSHTGIGWAIARLADVSRSCFAPIPLARREGAGSSILTANSGPSRDEFVVDATPQGMSPSGQPVGSVEPVVSFRGVSKRFGATLAVDNVDLDVAQGEIHALLGANGAGKSTLIKLLAGIYQPDAGEIYLNGRPLNRLGSDRSPIAFIHQDLGLFGWTTVAENIALVRGYPKRARLIDWARTSEEAGKALRILGSDIAPDTQLSALSQTEKAIVAIARALALEAEVVVLDEPTASLTESDVARLFGVLDRLRAHGVAITYVSHRLDEVFRLADRVTVLRDGKNVYSAPVATTNPAELVTLIIGRPPSEVFLKPPPATGTPLLEARDIRVGTLGPVSLQVMGGEILALTGLGGAGQNVIGRAICGIARISSGSIVLDGHPLVLRNAGDAVAHSIAFVSSNRQDEGLAPRLSVKENVFLNPSAWGRRIIDLMLRRNESARALRLAKRFLIRPPDPERSVDTLSGGNQQKVLLARSAGLRSALLVLEEPTRGVDVGAKAEIYQIIVDALDEAHAVILVSSDLEEVAGICSRALIFHGGAITSELPRDQMSLARLTHLVTGADVRAPVPSP
jgi:ribose transport system ATP-binding protein